MIGIVMGSAAGPLSAYVNMSTSVPASGEREERLIFRTFRRDNPGMSRHREERQIETR